MLNSRKPEQKLYKNENDLFTNGIYLSKWQLLIANVWTAWSDDVACSLLEVARPTDLGLAGWAAFLFYLYYIII